VRNEATLSLSFLVINVYNLRRLQSRIHGRKTKNCDSWALAQTFCLHKLSAMNVDFDDPNLDFLGSRKPAHEGIKERYPCKSRDEMAGDGLTVCEQGFSRVSWALAQFSCSIYVKQTALLNFTSLFLCLYKIHILIIFKISYRPRIEIEILISKPS